MKTSLSVVALALFATLAGCSSSGGTMDSDGATGTVRQHVINGKPSDASQDSVILLVHYDPSSGHVTGGGWINSPPGAYAPNPLLAGKASFGFVSDQM